MDIACFVLVTNTTVLVIVKHLEILLVGKIKGLLFKRILGRLENRGEKS